MKAKISGFLIKSSYLLLFLGTVLALNSFWFIKSTTIVKGKVTKLTEHSSNKQMKGISKSQRIGVHRQGKTAFNSGARDNSSLTDSTGSYKYFEKTTEYTVKGVAYMIVFSFTKDPAYKVGDEVEIRYKPESPEDSHINENTSLWFGASSSFFFALFFFFFGKLFKPKS